MSRAEAKVIDIQAWRERRAGRSETASAATATGSLPALAPMWTWSVALVWVRLW